MTELMIECFGCVGHIDEMDKETIETTFGPLDGKTYPIDHKEPPKGWMDRGFKAEKPVPIELMETIDINRFGAHENYQKRHGDFMQTYTGRKFWPMDPRAEEIFIEDIAHSLSMQCRYAGHCIRYYSVAEHSVLIARWILRETGNYEWALWALLHDASEAYLVDLPSPVKPHLMNYKAAESKVMAAVCERYKLPLLMPSVVHDADGRIIADELVNMQPMDWQKQHAFPLGVELRYWSPARAEVEFLATFEALEGNL